MGIPPASGGTLAGTTGARLRRLASSSFALVVLALACGGARARSTALTEVQWPITALEPQALSAPSAPLYEAADQDVAIDQEAPAYATGSFYVLAIRADPPRAVLGVAPDDDRPPTETVIVSPNGVIPLGASADEPLADAALPVVILPGVVPRVFRVDDGAPVALAVTAGKKPFTGRWSVLPMVDDGKVWVVGTTRTGSVLGRWDPTSGDTVDLSVELPFVPTLLPSQDPATGDVFVARRPDEPGCRFLKVPRKGAPVCVTDALGSSEDYPAPLGADRYLVNTDAGCAVVDLGAGTRMALSSGRCDRVAADFGHFDVVAEGRRLWWDGATLRSIPSGKGGGLAAPRGAVHPIGSTAEGRQIWLRRAGPAVYTGLARWSGPSQELPTVAYGVAGDLLVRVDLGAGQETPITRASCAGGWAVDVHTLRDGTWGLFNCAAGGSYIAPPGAGAGRTRLRAEGMAEPNLGVFSDAAFGRSARAHRLWFHPLQ